jgi:MFS family permease
MGSTGGVWAQPLLGRVADIWGYGTSYVVSAAIAIVAEPCLALSRRQNAPADVVQAVEPAIGVVTPATPTLGPEQTEATP